MVDGTQWHRLTSINLVERQAVCSICGPTPIRIRSSNTRGGGECLTARRKSKKPGSWRRHRYRLADADYGRLLMEQGGACAICRTATERLAVDHDHSCCPGRYSCGQCVRGLLCRDCNMGIGRFGDDAELLRRAADYVG